MNANQCFKDWPRLSVVPSRLARPLNGQNVGQAPKPAGWARRDKWLVRIRQAASQVVRIFLLVFSNECFFLDYEL